MRGVFLGLAAVPMLGASTVAAHHSNTAYDLDRVITFAGTVDRFEWANPHVYLRVEDDQGIVWQIETDSTPIMTRSGWTRQSFAQGDSVIVRANPHREGRTIGLLLSVEGPNGIPLTSRNRTERTADQELVASAAGLSGVWLGELLPISAKRRLPFVNDFVTHPLTEKGQVARANYDESMSPTAQCVSWPSPFLLAEAALHPAEFEIQEDVIIFRSEFFNTERVIYTDGREHPVNGERTNQGHSVGWWEDDVLIVDTTLFADHRSPYGGTGVPSGRGKHVVERYTLAEDGTQLIVDVFVEDPEFLAEPFSGRLVWHYSPHLEMLDFECDSAVATRFGE